MSSTPVTTVSLCHMLFRGGQKLGSLSVQMRRMATCGEQCSVGETQLTGQDREALAGLLKMWERRRRDEGTLK